MIARLINRLFRPFDSKEYYRRVYEPLKERAAELGIPDDEFILMRYAALKEAEPWIVGRAPGSLLRNLIDNWEADRAGLMDFLRANYDAPKPPTCTCWAREGGWRGGY